MKHSMTGLRDITYNTTIAGAGHAKASDCIKCRKCEMVCPQHLQIRNLLEKVAETFEK
jgi:predicted aldo/keto reductase-like oxidoreductase